MATLARAPGPSTCTYQRPCTQRCSFGQRDARSRQVIINKKRSIETASARKALPPVSADRQEESALAGSTGRPHRYTPSTLNPRCQSCSTARTSQGTLKQAHQMSQRVLIMIARATLSSGLALATYRLGASVTLQINVCTSPARSSPVPCSTRQFKA